MLSDRGGGGKGFFLNNRFKGEVTPEEQAIAQQHPSMKQAQAAQAERQAAAKAAPAADATEAADASAQQPASTQEENKPAE